MSRLEAEKLTWEKCPCGHPTCDRQYPTNLGTFYEGSGFDPDEVELLNRAFDALEREKGQVNQIGGEYALIVGICLGALMRFNPRDDDLIRLVLVQSGVKAIARAAPDRILASYYTRMGMSYEEDALDDLGTVIRLG